MSNNQQSSYELVHDHLLFLKELRNALDNPLPGLPAQRKMASLDRAYAPQAGKHPRQAAVIVIVYPWQRELMLLFTRRSLTLTHHSGQICFPGGRIEAQDQSVEAAALREAEEELGASMQNVQILGKLTSLYVNASNNMVHPVIGWLPLLPPLSPSPDEVDSVLHVPLLTLLNPASHALYHEPHHKPDDNFVPCYRYNGACIWGATAMMTSELIEVIKSTMGNGSRG